MVKECKYFLLAICIVDAWLLHKDGEGSFDCMSTTDLYSILAEQLYDNKYCTTFTRSQNIAANHVSSVTMSGIGSHLNPKNRKRKRSDASLTNCSYNGRYKIFKGIQNQNISTYTVAVTNQATSGYVTALLVETVFVNTYELIMLARTCRLLL